MTDVLKTRTEWLAGQRKGFVGGAVTYHYGASSVAVTATPGHTNFRFVDEYGRTVRVESRDYLINVADLPVEPERGHQIKEAQGGTTYVYEVLAPNDEPAWRFSGHYRTVYRIHTKLVDTE